MQVAAHKIPNLNTILNPTLPNFFSGISSKSDPVFYHGCSVLSVSDCSSRRYAWFGGGGEIIDYLISGLEAIKKSPNSLHNILLIYLFRITMQRTMK
jgi:hypothetical protein